MKIDCKHVLIDRVKDLVQWEQTTNGYCPSVLDTFGRKILSEKFPFWELVNTYICNRGLFPPLRLFKHGAKAFYSKMKMLLMAQDNTVPHRNLQWLF